MKNSTSQYSQVHRAQENYIGFPVIGPVGPVNIGDQIEAKLLNEATTTLTNTAIIAS